MNINTRLYLAWVVALVATIGSLYFSEQLNYTPCKLCWYQRIAMYPQVLLLGVAAFNNDTSVRRYVLPISGIGFAIALLQNAEIWGWIPVMKACSIDAGQEPCTTIWPLWTQIFGEAFTPLNAIFTVPVLSMIAFGLILMLLALPFKEPKNTQETPENAQLSDQGEQHA